MKTALLKVFPDNRKDYFNVSVSKIKSFKQCKARFLYEYIQKLPKKEKVFAQFGTFVHEVLEQFVDEVISGTNEPDHEIIKRIFIKSKDSLIENKEKVLVKKFNLLTDDEIKEAHVVLKNYLTIRKKLKEENKLPKFVCTEKEAILNIDDKILFNGYVDLIQVDHDGVLHVIDYKTVDKEKSIKYLKDDLLQLETYAYIMFLENPDLQVVRCSYSLVRFDFKLLTYEYTREKTLAMRDKLIEYVTNMQSEKLFRPSVGPLCPYCDFVSSCPEGEKKAEQIEKFKNGGAPKTINKW